MADEGAADEAADACLRCDAPLRWIDAAWACDAGCAYCGDCAEELGGTCANDSGELRAQRRTQPAGRPGKPAAAAPGPPAEGLK